METQSYNKFTHYKDESFELVVEVLSRVAYLHVTVEVWKPSVLKKMYSVLKGLLDWCSESGIIKVYTISPNPKFCRLMGGRSVSYVTYLDKEYEVFTWDLK